MNRSKTCIVGATTTLLIALIFATGFYIGSSRTNSFSVSASEAPVDMSPFWRVWDLLDDRFAPTGVPVTNEEKLWGAIQGLARSVDDPYTVFLPPVDKQEFDESISGEFSGVGMEISIQDDILTVVSPLKDTPAFKAGIQPGDLIIRIGDRITSDMTIDDAISLIRGEKGTAVDLTLLREGVTDPINVSVVRDTITIPTIDTETKGDVFVISLYNFNAQATTLFQDAMREFYISKKDKLILDLRGNPGGYLDSAIDITSWFLPAGKVVVRESFADEKDNRVFRSKGFDLISKRDVEVVVLIDGGSASASEIVAGALQEHQVAQLVGTQSFGKGSVQELLDITGNTALKVTIARWLTPNGLSISENGLTPDHIVEYISENEENDMSLFPENESDDIVDRQMQKALELLTE